MPTSSQPVNPVQQLKDRAVIGHTIHVKGDVSGEEDLTIQGSLDGTVQLKGHNVTVGEKGKVKADIHAKILSIEGRVDGNLTGEEQVIVRKTGQVTGNITAPRVTLEDGCRFSGSIDMESKAKGFASQSAGEERAAPRKIAAPEGKAQIS